MEVLYKKEEIQEQIQRMAQEIVRDWKDGPLVLIGLLKGCFLIMADLSRAIQRLKPSGDLYIDFMRVSSYGKNQQSSGDVKIEMDIQRSIKGIAAIIVDDVYDTGLTLSKVREHIWLKEPASLKLCVAFEKAFQGPRPHLLDYVGFRNVKGFLVGFGLDDKGRRRALEDACTLDGEEVSGK